MNKSLLLGVGVLLGAVGLLLVTEVSASAASTNPAPRCTQWKSMTGIDPAKVQAWMVEQQAEGRRRFIAPSSDATYTVMCAY